MLLYDEGLLDKDTPTLLMRLGLGTFDAIPENTLTLFTIMPPTTSRNPLEHSESFYTALESWESISLFSQIIIFVSDETQCDFEREKSSSRGLSRFSCFLTTDCIVKDQLSASCVLQTVRKLASTDFVAYIKPGLQLHPDFMYIYESALPKTSSVIYGNTFPTSESDVDFVAFAAKFLNTPISPSSPKMTASISPNQSVLGNWILDLFRELYLCPGTTFSEIEGFGELAEETVKFDISLISHLIHSQWDINIIKTRSRLTQDNCITILPVGFDTTELVLNWYLWAQSSGHDRFIFVSLDVKSTFFLEQNEMPFISFPFDSFTVTFMDFLDTLYSLKVRLLLLSPASLAVIDPSNVFRTSAPYVFYKAVRGDLSILSVPSTTGSEYFWKATHKCALKSKASFKKTLRKCVIAACALPNSPECQDSSHLFPSVSQLEVWESELKLLLLDQNSVILQKTYLQTKHLWKLDALRNISNSTNTEVSKISTSHSQIWLIGFTRISEVMETIEDLQLSRIGQTDRIDVYIGLNNNGPHSLSLKSFIPSLYWKWGDVNIIEWESPFGLEDSSNWSNMLENLGMVFVIIAGKGNRVGRYWHYWTKRWLEGSGMEKNLVGISAVRSKNQVGMAEKHSIRAEGSLLMTPTAWKSFVQWIGLRIANCSPVIASEGAGHIFIDIINQFNRERGMFLIYPHSSQLRAFTRSNGESIDILDSISDEELSMTHFGYTKPHTIYNHEDKPVVDLGDIHQLTIFENLISECPSLDS